MTPNDYAAACERAAVRLGIFSDSEALEITILLDALATALREGEPERVRHIRVSNGLLDTMDDATQREFGHVTVRRAHALGNQPTGRITITLPPEVTP